MTALRILFPETEIARRVESVARQIVERSPQPQIAVPILSGAFVFSADLLRALAKNGLDLPVEFLWLRSYADSREGGAIAVLGPSLERIAGQHVLLIDGVLDRGRTMAKAKSLMRGAKSVTTVVAVDKMLEGVLEKSDLALFTGTRGFIVGYGMDDAQTSRGLPYIACVD